MLSCFTRNDSSDDTMAHSHENETFDEPISTLFGINMSPFVYHVCDEYLASKSESESDFSKGYTGGWSLLIVLGNTMRTKIEDCTDQSFNIPRKLTILQRNYRK